MKLIAQRQLCGEYGLVRPGESFEPRDEVAQSLLHRGLAVVYETKIVTPAETQAATEPGNPRRNRTSKAKR